MLAAWYNNFGTAENVLEIGEFAEPDPGKGEVKIKLELINSDGKLVDSPFNPSVRTVILEK